jgi:hypothetical protein
MGCSIGLGGKDRCSHGGAVRLFESRFGVPLFSRASFLLLVTSFSLVCSRQTGQVAPDPIALLSAVPPADPAKFPPLQQNKHWSNPYLVIRADTVGLLSDATANEEELLKPEEVLKALAALPKSAWPYGRAVAVLVDTKSGNSDQDQIAMRRNRGIVAGELQGAQVAIDWVPSS